MSAIRVIWQGMNAVLDDQDEQQLALMEQIAALRGVQNQREIRSGAYSALLSSLDRLIVRLDNDRNHLRKLSMGLSSILNQYCIHEQRVIDRIHAPAVTDEENAVTSAEGEPAMEETEIEIFSWEDFWKLVSEIGIAGAIISSIGGLITGGLTPISVATAFDSILKAVGGVASKIATGPGVSWKDAILGLDNGLSGINTSSGGKAFTSSLKKQFVDDLSFGSAKTVADKVAVGVKWGGYALTGVTNLLENIEEFQGVEGAAERIISETVVETGVDIGLGAITTAGVSAGLAALGVTAPPVVVVGLASAGVVWAANGVCKWVTGGKDIGEVTADTFTAAKEVVSDAVDHTVKAVKEGFGAFVNWGKALFA